MTLRPNTKYLAISFCFIAAVLFTGCGSSRSSQKSTLPALTTSSAALGNGSFITEPYKEWSRVKIPVTLRLRQPKNASVSGTAIMERDKSIMISLRFIGMEIANLYITDDSLIAIDKYNKKFVAEAVKPLLGGFPATISNVQDILMGRPFLVGKSLSNVKIKNDFEIESAEGSDVITVIPRKMPQGVEYGFAFNTAGSLTTAIVKAGSHEPVNIDYSNIASTPYGPFAGSTAVTATAGKTSIDAILEWNVGKASWNDNVELRRPSIPRNYERISASKLIKAFSSL